MKKVKEGLVLDVSKLTVKLPVDEFYNTYIATIRELYSESFIAQNHLEPSTKSSFQRAMSKRAGISLDTREDTKQYTKDDLIAIIEDTNAKYEEYVRGDYSESIRTRGEARYRLMSTVLRETLIRLGYPDIADMFKYAEKSQGTADKNIETVCDEVITVKKDQEDDITVKKNIELLQNSLSVIKDKIAEFSSKELSEQDKESLKKLNSTLTDTLKSAVKCVEGKNGFEDLKSLIKQGEEYSMRLEDIIASTGREKLQQMVQEADTPEKVTVEQFEVSYDSIVKVLKVLPGFVEQLQEAVKERDKLQQQVYELQKEIETVKAQNVLPGNEDELVKTAKEIINKIEDKTKLKDIGMVIMMKAL